jgi:ubiquinone biosynthesis accessory factor UbiJ
MLAQRFEALLARQLEASPRARQLVARLEGKPLRVAPRHLPWTFTVHAAQGTLRLVVDDEAAAAATVSGTPLSLVALAGRDPQAVIRRGDVHIDGDAEVADLYRELASLLRPDLEEELSRWVGDVPAHEAGSLARSALGWLGDVLQTASDNLGEYLAHERRDLVPRAEAQGFLDGVDELRERVDRLQARLDVLQARDAPAGAAP